MHIPDNFLSPPVWATLDGIAAPTIAYISKRAQSTAAESTLPLLGMMGAFVFATQLINFPVGIGTSGHLVGGTLLACVLGPWAASVVLTGILLIQAFVFQDGGVLALGANTLNMAVAGVWAGYLPYVWLRQSRVPVLGVVAGGFASVMTSGLLALGELRLSGIEMSGSLIALSIAVFAVNALIEGALTASVLRAIRRFHPGAIPEAVTSGPPTRLLGALGISAALLASLGVLAGPPLPDGLERLGNLVGMPFTSATLFSSPLSDYQIHSFGAGWLSRASAGLVGLAAVYLLCMLSARLLVRLRRDNL